MRFRLEDGPCLFHHARELEHVRFDVVHGYCVTDTLPEPACTGHCSDILDDWHTLNAFETSYRWLSERSGFWPLFLGVGPGDDLTGITGYLDNANRYYPRERSDFRHRERVQFSWRAMPEPIVFTDYSAWHSALSLQGVTGRPHEWRITVTPWEERCIFKPSWTTARWLRSARDPRKGNCPVQAVTPALDLRAADEVWCWNQRTRRALLALGFDEAQVRIRRIRFTYFG